MTEKTITRADLADALYQKLGLSRSESADIVDSVFEEMSDGLIDGENVKISGFGSFVLRDKKERIGRNPKTGEQVQVPAKKVPYFKPSKALKVLVNSGHQTAVNPAPTSE